MKQVIFAVPVAVLCAAAAFAQTETTTAPATTGAAGEMFGMNWPLSVETTFFTDATGTSLRSTEELTSGWQSLSPEDQAMIRTDCEAFTAAHGDGAATDAGGTAASGSAATGTTATGTEATADTGAAAKVPAGYDMAKMKMICEAVGKF